MQRRAFVKGPAAATASVQIWPELAQGVGHWLQTLRHASSPMLSPAISTSWRATRNHNDWGALGDLAKELRNRAAAFLGVDLSEVVITRNTRRA
jgi:selenocysteine lyase/cysteine desulfurase